MGFFSFLFGTTKSSECLPFENIIKFNRIKSEHKIEIGEELKFDEYGYQVSLNSLLKDFLNAGLIEGKVRMNDWSVVKITSLGKKFLQLNVID